MSLVSFTVVLTTSVLFATPHFKTDLSNWYAYNDSMYGGESKNISVHANDSGAVWTFKLGLGSPWPYAGLSYCIKFNDTLDKTYSLNDTLFVDLSSNRAGPVTMQLSTFDSVVTKHSDLDSRRVSEFVLTVPVKPKRIAIPLNNFRVATWWQTKYKIPPENNNLFLDSICTINWVFTDTARIDHADTLTISNLSIKKYHKNDWSRIIYIILTAIFLAGIATVIHLKKNFKKSAANQTILPISTQPRPLDTGPSEWNKVIFYLENNYHRPELDLQTVSRELGFSESKLYRLFRDNYNEGFRSLIHSMRTREACRLLKETDLNIAEIAYKLGYATPSHFNREFKQRQNITPSEFRKNGVTSE